MTSETEALNQDPYTLRKGFFDEEQRAMALRWAVTLESGNYEQAKFVLRTKDNRCCCWGVLCDIVDPKGWAMHAEANCYKHRGVNNIPALHLLKQWTNSCAFNYANMNDAGKSFVEIAARIRNDFGLPPR